MSISDVRDAFNTVAISRGIRCTNALLIYCDKDGKPDGLRTYQQLVFNCVNASDNSTKQHTSDILPPGANVNAAAAETARKVVGE
jgi:hypothetical protein